MLQKKLNWLKSFRFNLSDFNAGHYHGIVFKGSSLMAPYGCGN